MFKRKSKAFTLIELIATLVIMAIIALIVTPLVMNIIRKARISADKRSIDAYGRSIELAIASYLLDTGRFPTNVSELTIEYSGNHVECETTQINSDSSVYLANCKVNNREVTNYIYGHDLTPPASTYTAYTVGDQVTYNGVDYYVIKNSGKNESTVTLLKAEPLTVDEVNLYGGVGTDNNHVNRYTINSQGTAYNSNGYGGMTYYSSETCGYNGGFIETGCKNSYEESDIKHVVDNWKIDKFDSTDLVIDSTGYSARLITTNELVESLGYDTEIIISENTDYLAVNSNVPTWVYNNNYRYWTMTEENNSTSRVFDLTNSGNFDSFVAAYCYECTVRPVITISKSVL